MMIVAPEVRLKTYEIQSPVVVKKQLSKKERNIIVRREAEYFSAMYGGMVSRAMTSINPTILIIMTTESATIARRRK